ncbi:hypothetical protein [Azohydromonas australica]|uniref:hypothetical protein n=1 Tax=Azohydromonas australica TaxID=364039 RepID=UPI000421D5B5|nr:hypothetical protein [Azohydromonas australica]
MNVITVMLFEEQFSTLVAVATTAQDQAKACASSLGLSPTLGLQYRDRAAALGNALMALEMNVRPGNVSAELADLKERHAELLRQLDEEKARADELAAALGRVLERHPTLNSAEIDAARALVTHS